MTLVVSSRVTPPPYSRLLVAAARRRQGTSRAVQWATATATAAASAAPELASESTSSRSSCPPRVRTATTKTAVMPLTRASAPFVGGPTLTATAMTTPCCACAYFPHHPPPASIPASCCPCCPCTPVRPQQQPTKTTQTTAPYHYSRACVRAPSASWQCTTRPAPTT